MTVRRDPAQQSTEEEPKKKRSAAREVFSFLRLFLGMLALIFLLQTFLVQFVRVKGTSMCDTLQNGEIALVTKWDRNFHRGDVVICQYPGRTDFSADVSAAAALTVHTIFVKRLVALPGDTVMIRDGKLYVNGSAVADPEKMASTPRDYPERTLGADEYFVIGDNRFSSHDSRAADVGPLRLSMLLGKVKAVIWPLYSIRAVSAEPGQ